MTSRIGAGPIEIPRREALLGGGGDGNERLTTQTGLLLIAALAALGVTIVLIGALLWEHLFIGFLLLGPVLLKLATTGYRFVGYYSGRPTYVRRGPPWTPLRLIAPVVVLSTVVVFGTGVVLLFAGPPRRDPWLLLHKASFIVWIAFTALHVLGHLSEIGRLLGVRTALLDLPGAGSAGEAGVPAGATAGGAGRMVAVMLALVAGVALALALIPDYGTWTGDVAALHHRGN